MKIRTFFTLMVCAIAVISCSPQKHKMRIMSYNIRIGVGTDVSPRGLTDIVPNLERTAEVIKRINPDSVGLQEVDSVAQRSNWVDQTAVLAELTGMHPIFAPAIERSEGLYGIAALVKEKPLAIRNIQLPGEEELRTFLVLEYEDYILCNTHFSLRKPSRLESVEIIRNTLKEYDKPAVITGDFNMRTGSEECAMMGEDWTLLSDSTKVTFPANGPRVTLDYIWGYKGHEYEVLEYVVEDEPIASDHLPIYIDVRF